MKSESTTVHELTTPQFIDHARYLNQQLSYLGEAQLAGLMGVSNKIAHTAREQIAGWANKKASSAAALTFRGDIYSGLAAASWNQAAATFAQKHLLILSGLYGLLRPFDAIDPYRLEMDYRLKLPNSRSLHKFWNEEIVSALDVHDSYINLTSKEYFKVVERQLDGSEVISPKFMTVSEKTKLPVFVTVHAKIARGSFANWLITNKIDDPKQVYQYDQLNYRYDRELSSTTQPVFVSQKFGGLGLSVRLRR